MLSILINAYACSPDMGSEPGMAWNWCVNLAKYCELYIITEGEFREKIEQWLTPSSNVPDDMSVNEYGLSATQIRNLHFYYNPVSDDIRRMCWNQGDWRFYYYYKKWQWKTYEMAMQIMQEVHIDIIHQLNMIGFREPGYLWKVSQMKQIPFVWGPIGGLKLFPMEYASGNSFITRILLQLKNVLNVWQLKYSSRVDKALKQASLLISSIPDSYYAIKKYKGLESVVIPETGTFIQEKEISADLRFRKDCLTIIWVGKFDFRKRLDLALSIMSLAVEENPNIVLKIFGTGNERQVAKINKMVKSFGIDRWIQFMGNCSHDIILDGMGKADLFLFTSVNEDTSTVVLEAVGKQLPILCFDTCGMSAVVTDDIGIKIPLTNPNQSIKEFAEKIKYLNKNRVLLQQMSENCAKRIQELSWEHKAQQMTDLYEKVVNGKDVYKR